MHPLTKYPGRTVVLSPQCFASSAWYGALAAHESAVIDTRLRYDKRFKSIHRYRIADVRGALDLTVPVGHPLPGGERLWSRVMVSDHGQWPHVHLTTLESAYGRTPYFEFYIDRLRPLLSYRDISVTEFCLEADAAVRAILGIPTRILDTESVDFSDPGLVDLRHPASLAPFAPAPYRQVREEALGFIPDLSILDLIFNCGPESPLHLLISPESELNPAKPS